MKWEKVKLGDVCKSIADGDHQSPQKQVQGIPFITISNIDANNRIDFTNSLYVSEDYYESIADKRKAAKDDVLYSVVGSFGVPVLLRENIKFAFQRHIAILRPDKEKIFPAFLYYSMLTRDFYLQADSVAIGSAQRTITLTTLKNMKLSLPPLPVQKRIASILSAYDDLIENNQKQINLLEEAAQRLYKEWFVDLRFPGHESVKIVDGVPEGWNKVRLDEVTSVLKRGISPKYDENGEFTVINQKCIRKNIVDYSESRKQSKKYAEELQLQESDTVICSTGIGTLGRVGQIYNVYQNSTFDSHVTLVRANKLIGKQFLFWSLKLLQPYLMSLGKGSTNQQELYKSDLTACFLLLPEEYIMNAFERQAQELHDIIAVKTKQISSLREARDRLLPKLMSGEIEV